LYKNIYMSLIIILLLILLFGIYFYQDYYYLIDGFDNTKTLNFNLNCGGGSGGVTYAQPDVIVPVYSPWRTYYPWSWVYPYNWNYPYYWSQYNFW
jgi:hypothetical protein